MKMFQRERERERERLSAQRERHDRQSRVRVRRATSYVESVDLNKHCANQCMSNIHHGDWLAGRQVAVQGATASAASAQAKAVAEHWPAAAS